MSKPPPRGLRPSGWPNLFLRLFQNLYNTILKRTRLQGTTRKSGWLLGESGLRPKKTNRSLSRSQPAGSYPSSPLSANFLAAWAGQLQASVFGRPENLGRKKIPLCQQLLPEGLEKLVPRIGKRGEPDRIRRVQSAWSRATRPETASEGLSRGYGRRGASAEMTRWKSLDSEETLGSSRPLLCARE